MENNPDNITVRKVLDGDAEAYREIIGRHGVQVFALVSGIVRNRQDAEEVTSDIFLKAFQQLKKFRGDSKFSTWLYRIAYNTAISHTRRRKPTGEDIDEKRMESVTDDQEEAVLAQARIEELEKGMDRLPQTERLLLDLFYMQDMSIDDISAITGDAPGNVKVKLHRTRKKLAAIIGNNV